MLKYFNESLYFLKKVPLCTLLFYPDFRFLSSADALRKKNEKKRINLTELIVVPSTLIYGLCVDVIFLKNHFYLHLSSNCFRGHPCVQYCLIFKQTKAIFRLLMRLSDEQIITKGTRYSSAIFLKFIRKIKSRKFAQTRK